MQVLVLNKQKVRWTLMLVLIFIFVLSLLDYTEVIPVSVGGNEADVILDAGHGGVDSGAYLENIKEKDITLDVVLRIGSILEAKGLQVKLTRDSDSDLGGALTKGRHRRDLEARLKTIDRGRIAVSVHVNTTGDSRECGAVVFYARNSQAGQRLATSILRELAKIHKLNYPEAIPRSNLFLLRASRIPVALVELGFLSNLDDRQKLIEPYFRQQCAQAIAAGISEYLNSGSGS